MSGGSLDYLYRELENTIPSYIERLNEAIAWLLEFDDPDLTRTITLLRIKMSNLEDIINKDFLILLHDIEWLLSGDYSITTFLELQKKEKK